MAYDGIVSKNLHLISVEVPAGDPQEYATEECLYGDFCTAAKHWESEEEPLARLAELRELIDAPLRYEFRTEDGELVKIPSTGNLSLDDLIDPLNVIGKNFTESVGAGSLHPCEENDDPKPQALLQTLKSMGLIKGQLVSTTDFDGDNEASGEPLIHWVKKERTFGSVSRWLPKSLQLSAAGVSALRSLKEQDSIRKDFILERNDLTGDARAMNDLARWTEEIAEKFATAGTAENPAPKLTPRLRSQAIAIFKDAAKRSGAVDYSFEELADILGVSRSTSTSVARTLAPYGLLYKSYRRDGWSFRTLTTYVPNQAEVHRLGGIAALFDSRGIGSE